MNAVQLIGRLTASPSVTTRKETTVGEFRLAIQRPKRNGNDDGADYIDITVFGRLAETVGEYLTKGRKVAVTGRLRHQEWEGENGRRQKIDVVADNVEFLEARRTEDADTTAEPAEAAAA
jgi:single-strand DNA-binding protein